MHILITTAGVLPPEPVADFVEALIRSDGRVTVMNVVQTPQEFLQELDSQDWQPFDASDSPVSDPQTNLEARRYVRERGEKMVAPVVAALKCRNINPETKFVESNDVAAGIVTTSEELSADAIVMGVTRRLFTESAWTSISMKVTTAARVPVLLIPNPQDRTAAARARNEPVGDL